MAKEIKSDVLDKMRANVEDRKKANIEEELLIAEVSKILELVPRSDVDEVATLAEDIKETTKSLNTLKETRADKVKDIKEMLVSKGIDEAKIALAYPDVEMVKAMKGTAKKEKGGPTKEDKVLEAIKNGNNTKKGLEAIEDFGGDVHTQIYGLGKKGLIEVTSPGAYVVVG